uniref:FYVE-type domain-containing protein n=1 Tax=Peronospora matthiolae TaxID=2874970 RepID=A0AAV1TIS8_9STRA
MNFFKRPLTEAEQAQRRARKELERLAKTQRKFDAMAEKAQKAQRKQQQQSIARSEKEAQRQAKQEQQAASKAMKEAKKASKQRGRLARHAAKLRGHRRDRPVSCSATASASDVAGTEMSRPLAKRAHCAVCGKKFGPALHRRRHHCRQCRESCCLQCTSQTRHVIPQTGRTTRQKVCVVCDTLIFTARTSTTATTTNTMTTAAIAAAPVVREPAEAIVALAAAHRRASIGRRPRSAPLPRTSGVAVAVPCPRGPRARSSQSSSRWKLSMRAGLRKKKRRAEQLRNGDMDHSLQVEKHALFMGPAISVQPQTRMAPPAPMREQGRDAIAGGRKWMCMKKKELELERQRRKERGRWIVEQNGSVVFDKPAPTSVRSKYGRYRAIVPVGIAYFGRSLYFK